MIKALSYYGLLRPIINAPPGGALAKAIKARPETVGAVLWPYQCSAWDVRTRLCRIRGHYDAVDATDQVLSFPANATLNLLDLAEIEQGLRVTIDQPKWLMREGQLAISLFMVATRIYSLAFSLFQEADGRLVAVVGAIQGCGCELDDARGEYRRLTKAAHGMRPRDLLFEAFRMFCAEMGVNDIVAVADEYRHHRHRYFANEPNKCSADYNEIWADRGGIRTNAMFYRFDPYRKQRPLAEIRPNKRAMYRRRYRMLDSLNEQLSKNVLSLYEARKCEAVGGFVGSRKSADL